MKPSRIAVAIKSRTLRPFGSGDDASPRLATAVAMEAATQPHSLRGRSDARSEARGGAGQHGKDEFNLVERAVPGHLGRAGRSTGGLVSVRWAWSLFAGSRGSRLIMGLTPPPCIEPRPPTSWSSAPARLAGAPRSRPRRPASRCACSASARSSTRTPCSRRAASTRRSGRAIPRTPGSSTSPTRCARATCSGDPRMVEILARESPARGPRAGRLGLRVRADPGRRARPAVLRRPSLAADVLRGRLHGPRDPAHARSAGRRARHPRRGGPVRVAAARRRGRLLRRPGLRPAVPGSGPSTWPTPSSWRRAVIPASGDGARRAATRTTATACAWRSTPAAG